MWSWCHLLKRLLVADEVLWLMYMFSLLLHFFEMAAKLSVFFMDVYA
jgi:hypothetical protein